MQPNRPLFSAPGGRPQTPLQLLATLRADRQRSVYNRASEGLDPAELTRFQDRFVAAQTGAGGQAPRILHELRTTLATQANPWHVDAAEAAQGGDDVDRLATAILERALWQVEAEADRDALRRAAGEITSGQLLGALEAPKVAARFDEAMTLLTNAALQDETLLEEYGADGVPEFVHAAVEEIMTEFRSAQDAPESHRPPQDIFEELRVILRAAAPELLMWPGTAQLHDYATAILAHTFMSQPAEADALPQLIFPLSIHNDSRAASPAPPSPDSWFQSHGSSADEAPFIATSSVASAEASDSSPVPQGHSDGSIEAPSPRRRKMRKRTASGSIGAAAARDSSADPRRTLEPRKRRRRARPRPDSPSQQEGDRAQHSTAMESPPATHAMATASGGGLPEAITLRFRTVLDGQSLDRAVEAAKRLLAVATGKVSDRALFQTLDAQGQGVTALANAVTVLWCLGKIERDNDRWIVRNTWNEDARVRCTLWQGIGSSAIRQAAKVLFANSSMWEGDQFPSSYERTEMAKAAAILSRLEGIDLTDDMSTESPRKENNG